MDSNDNNLKKDQVNVSELNSALELAQMHERSARGGDAEKIYRNIISTQPQFHPAYQALALMAFSAGNLQFAAELFQSAIAIDKNVAIYHRNYGEICRRLGRVADAIEAGMQACKLVPLDIDACFNLALAYSDAKDHLAAQNAYRKVLQLQEAAMTPGNATPQLWNQRGVALHRLQHFDEARRSYECALALDPNYAVAHNSLGSVLREMGLVGLSGEHFSKALQLAPAFAEARLNLGMTQLQLGDWENGWENYEARWTGSAESKIGTFARPNCPLPQWQGHGEAEGQALLVFAEQGFGDTFQFTRYLMLAARHFSHIAVVYPWSNTHLLMEWSFGDQVLLLKQMPTDFTPWHWQCPLMSLPRAFHTRPGTVPASVPYLKVPQIASAHWRTRLGRAASKRLTVGLAWQGRRSHQYDLRRSLDFTQLLPLLREPNIAWVSLQKLEAADTRPDVPEHVQWIDWTAELFDFSDTAALISNLDLIISIDSSMAHLAGALARPVWMLNRYDCEWRWTMQSEDSPWYPSMRIFNQPKFGDWNSVIGAVQSALQKKLLESGFPPQ